MTKLVNENDHRVLHAWHRIVSTKDWEIVANDLRTRALLGLYRDATARADCVGNGWAAGRAALMEDFLLALAVVKERSSTSSAGGGTAMLPPITIKSLDGNSKGVRI